MDGLEDIDLAGACADVVGSAGAVTVLLNRLMRQRPDAPKELRLLRSQLVLAKQRLDKMLPLLDCDDPVFRSPAHVTELDTIFTDISLVFKDVHDCAARVADARDAPDVWSSVWKTPEMVDAEAALKTHLVSLVPFVDDPAASPKADDMPSSKSAAAAPPQSPPSVSSSSQLPTPTPSQEVGSPASISSDRPPEYGETMASAPGHPQLDQSQSRTSSPQTDASPSQSHAQLSSSSDLELVHRSPPPGRYATPSYRPLASVISSRLQMGRDSRPRAPSTGAPRSMADVNRSMGSLAINNWQPVAHQPVARQAPAASTACPSNWKSKITTAREVKSNMMLGLGFRKKDKLAGLDTAAPSGDELYPAKFKHRASAYAGSMPPAWEVYTKPAKGRKPARQMCRNRFTRQKSDDVEPDRQRSKFRILDKELWEAILHKQTDRVQEIMQHRWNDNVVLEDKDEITALHVAASLGLSSIVQMLVSLGASPKDTDRFGVTPLHYAADFGCPASVRFLSAAGASVAKEAPKHHILSPLWYAAREGNNECVKTLLELGAPVYTQTRIPEETVMYAAVRSGDLATCETLLRAGANSAESFAVLSQAAETSIAMFTLLCSWGADVNMREPETQNSLLHRWAGLGEVETVEAILRNGGAVDPRNGEMQTPLHVATTAGFADVAQALCRAGASPEALDASGNSPWAETQKDGFSMRTHTTAAAAASDPGPSRLNSTKTGDFPGVERVLSYWRRMPHASSTVVPARAELPAPRANPAATVPARRELPGSSPPAMPASAPPPPPAVTGPAELGARPQDFQSPPVELP